jgi:hypothetical protein
VDQRAYVPWQAVLLVVGGVGGAVICGHKAGFAITLIAAVGAVIWIGLFAPYRARIREMALGPGGVRRRMDRRPDSRQEQDRRALSSGALGFGLPVAAGIAVWQAPSFRGVWLHSGTAAFGAALVVLLFTAILASSMVDWYLILPWCFGLFRGRPPIWVPTAGEIPSDAECSAIDNQTDTVSMPAGGGPGLDKDQRRRIAQVWVFHRGLCELITLTCVAFLLAIGLVALGHALSKDPTLPTAFESLGGAGIAVGIFGGFLGPRLRGAMNFMLSGPVEIGTWVRGPDDFRKDIDGYFVDISIHPGMKVIKRSGERDFIPLAFAHKPSQIDRPQGLEDGWEQRAVTRHLGRDPSKEGRQRFSRAALKQWPTAVRKLLQNSMQSEEVKP